MKRLLLIGCLLPLGTFAQLLSYSPGKTIQKEIPESYYNTEFMYMRNVSGQTLDLNFNTILDSASSEWHSSACSGSICYNHVPESGFVGTLQPDEEGYFSINLSTNETNGEGIFRFVITASNVPELADTISFIYQTGDDSAFVAQPWARMNLYNNQLTVTLKNPQTETELRIYDLSGNRIAYFELEAIYSLDLRQFGSGTYVAVVTDTQGRELKEKIVVY